MRKSMLILIFLILPIIIEFADISYGSVFLQTSFQLRVIMLKEIILTPDVLIVDDKGIERFGVGRIISDPAESQIDFNFIEDMRYEKQYIRLLYMLRDR